MTHQLVSIGWMLLALVLSASIGLERQIRGKSAGIRTQAIVGLTACLMMLISKYGFSDILIDGITRYDPSRVASQIVSGIGFLGAGIILTRHGAIRGLTTAATIWETAAIGMACGAGLWWLALAGTALHFIVIALLTPLVQFILMRTHGHKVTLSVHYSPGHGVLSTSSRRSAPWVGRCPASPRAPIQPTTRPPRASQRRLAKISHARCS